MSPRPSAFGAECEHGRLARSCDICDRDEEIEEARRLLVLAYDRLCCTDPDDEYPDGQTHRCGCCDYSVDRNCEVREQIRHFLHPEGDHGPR